MHTGGNPARLHIRKQKKVIQNPKRLIPGALIEFDKEIFKKRFVLTSSTGKVKIHPAYFKDEQGNRCLYGKCRVLQYNQGLVYL